MTRLLLTLALCAAPASAIQVERIRVARPATQGGGFYDSEVAAGEALVRFEKGLSASDRDALLQRFGAGFVRQIEGSDWSRVRLPAGLSVPVALGLLRGNPGILEAYPNGVYRALRVPNDVSYGPQYHHGKINAPAAWEYEVGDSSRVTVVVVDAGIEGTHPDLQPKIAAGSRDCSSGVCVANDPPTMSCNHGTRVAGVAAAATNNGIGVAGVSWGAQLLSAKVFANADCNSQCCSAGGDCSLAGNTCATTDADMIAAINYAASLHNTPTHGKIVINLSVGAGEPCGQNGPAFQTAVTNAVNAGVVLVAAAGNSGGDVNKPGNCSGVIPVGATTETDNVASFSSRGPELAANGVSAPGQSITTTDLNGAVTGGATGTSFSAPIVSGLAALILAAKPSFTPTQVKDAIRGGAENIGIAAAGENAFVPMGNTTGAGRVNAFRAMKLAVDGTLAGFAGDQKVIAFPNPFRTNETGAVTITIPPSLAGRNASLKVYTIDGQLVRDLKAQTTWDGRNDAGTQVATGVYIILVKTDAGTSKARVAVIR